MTNVDLGRISRAIGITLVLAARPCQAQTPSPLVHHPLDSGTVVRVHPVSGPPEAGRLMAPFASESTTFRYCLYHARPCLTPTDATWRERNVRDIMRVEVKVGSHSRRGFLIGSAACGTVWAFVSPFAGWPDWTDNPANFLVDLVGGMLISAPTCGGIGALIGAQSPRWGPPPN